MTPSIGFDALVSSLQFDMKDSFDMGLSDESFFNQSIEKIKRITAPYFVQLVTLSWHPPFKIPKNRSK
jgi:phosphoglycerol transferase MdoB-like AlkP superfamily enzyme